MGMIGACTAPIRASANISTTESIRVGSCQATTAAGPDAQGDEACGDPLAAAGELGERETTVALVEEHHRVGRAGHRRSTSSHTVVAS